MENVAHFCSKCGAERKSQDDGFCGRCGALFDSKGSLPESAVPLLPATSSLTTTTAPQSHAQRERQRRRRLLVVGALTFLTFGLYQYWWMGATWAELKRELEDEDMHPFWHVMSLLVPIFGLFKFYGHFNKISNLPSARSVGGTMFGGLALVLAILATVVGGVGSLVFRPTGISALIPSLFVTALFIYIVVRSQSDLNDYWLSFGAAGRVIPFRTHWLEWTIIGFGILFFLLVLLGAAAQA